MAGKGVLESLERSVRELIADNGRLRDDVEKLREGREKLKEENKRLARKVGELDKKLAVKELAHTFGDVSRVDAVIRQVDGCIKLLNK